MENLLTLPQDVVAQILCAPFEVVVMLVVVALGVLGRAIKSPKWIIAILGITFAMTTECFFGSPGETDWRESDPIARLALIGAVIWLFGYLIDLKIAEKFKQRNNDH